MALTIVTTNTWYYPDPAKGIPISLGKIYVGKPDLDPTVEANRLPLVLRQEDGTDVPIAVNQQPIRTSQGGMAQYQDANVQIFVDGNYSIQVDRANDTQAYYVRNVLGGVPVARGDTIIRYSNLADLRINGVSTDLTVWVDGNDTFGDAGEGIFHWLGSSLDVDDDGVTIEIDSTTNGRYIRADYVIFSVGFYGIKTDGSDNSVAFLSAKAATSESKFIPPGTYNVPSGDFAGVLFHSSGAVVITGNTTLRVNSNKLSNGGQYIKITDTKAATTTGGTSVSLAYQDRDLNTIDNDVFGLVSLASNQFTLSSPGRYRITAYSVAYKTDSNRIRLYNVSDASVEILGKNTNSSSLSNVQTEATLSGEFTITGSKIFKIEHYTQTAQASTGLGTVVFQGGESEVYTVVELWRVTQ